MATKATKICKVCGKEYEYCRTENTNNRFRWQEVACCPEHGAEYFRRIEESRAGVKTDDIDEPTNTVTEGTTNIAEDELLASDELAEEFVIDRMYNSEEAVG